MAERDGFDHDQLFQLVATERHPAILHEFGHGEELVCGLSLHPAGELQELPG
ncbi:MAG: hypothetical protein R3B95_03100 [Nitrospirales bacterium]|nr:hypothetical protein [Nitrospirales bacterium]